MIPGLGMTQYRSFEVYEIVHTKAVHGFLSNLLIMAQSCGKLLIVSSNEILKGRAQDGRVIAHHVDYLIGDKRIHPNDRPMSEGFGRKLDGRRR